VGPAAIQLIIVDVDGTLIGQSGEPSPAVRRAITDARSAGVAISLCTGRPMASAGAIARDLGLVGPHVAFNGALVRDLARPTAVFRRPLPTAALNRMIVLGREAELCVEIYTEAAHYVERDWSEARRHSESIRVPYALANFDTFFGRDDIIKIQIVTGDDRGRAAAVRIAEQFAGILRFSVAIPVGPAAGLECVNVVEQSVSKGSAVRALLEYYRLSQDQVAGVGDALNDLPMLGEVGLRIAMGNAEHEVKAIADIVVDDVESDGLAVAIDLLLAGSA
jgi:Cof subfamily protein (haloacid dehalogenase superfamily)